MLLRAASRARVAVPRLRHCRSACTEADAVGLGFATDELQGVSRVTLIKAMMGHVDTPERFDPTIAHVSVRAASGDAFFEGALWRSLTRTDGETSVEHCYANPMDGEIRFVRLVQPGDQEGPLEVVLELHRVPLRIEHYQRERLTLRRVHWDAPRARIAASVDATVRLARAAEAEAMDVSFREKEFPS